jgi:hypothetical protein
LWILVALISGLLTWACRHTNFLDFLPVVRNN